MFSTRHQWFACARLRDPHLPRSRARRLPRRSPPRLLTAAARGWFAASACTTAAEGHRANQPSSSISRAAPSSVTGSSTSSLPQRSCSHLTATLDEVLRHAGRLLGPPDGIPLFPTATDEGECDAEPAVAAASDDEQLRSLRELLVDESGTDGTALLLHKSSSGRDRIADPPDARSSSTATAPPVLRAPLLLPHCDSDGARRSRAGSFCHPRVCPRPSSACAASPSANAWSTPLSPLPSHLPRAPAAPAAIGSMAATGRYSHE
jgi:hypothetical protein